jgi:hypothetical protein
VKLATPHRRAPYHRHFFSFGAAAQISVLAYLHENSPFHLGLLDLRHSVGLLGRVISSSQGLCLHTRTENAQTLNFHALSGIRTHDPGLRAGECSACLRPFGYRDRHIIALDLRDSVSTFHAIEKTVIQFLNMNS